jgi:hypothetical protein
MSNVPVLRRLADRSGSRRAQSLVEFALVLPVLLLLLVIAIDAGRLFFQWVELTNQARVGANYAATHPIGMDTSKYEDLIAGEADVLNCATAPPPLPSYTKPDGTAAAPPVLGDYASVSLTCAFQLVTPLAGAVLGHDTLDLNATAVFPVRYGCAGCPPPPPAPEPVPPNQCRKIPAMAGISVAGARLAWQSAGFSTAKFTPLTGQDTKTVAPGPSVTEDDPDSGCSPGWAIFSSSVIVTTVAPDPVVPPCQTVPNLIGVTVATARTTWTLGPPAFTGGFQPPDQDTRVVTGQTTIPASTPGVSCIAPDASIVVTYGDPWAPPPPPPCKVPNFSDKHRDDAQPLWSAAGFTTTVAYDGPNNNFKIKSQTLVGGDWVDCGSFVTVSNKPHA